MGINKNKKPYTNDELVGFGRWAKPYLESFILGDLIEVWPRKKAQTIRLEIDLTDDVYTDGKRIHLGLGMLRQSTDLISDAYYMVGHELQHLHSTRDRDWVAGQVKAEAAIYGVLTERALGRRKVPVDGRDVIRTVKVLEKAGVYISQESVGKFAHAIQNILEDGRIEGIRHALHPGFTANTVQYRVSEWEQNPIADYSSVDLTAREELNIVMSQLYYLATMGHWQKGFSLQFHGKSSGRNMAIYERCSGLIPIVARAVMGKTCKECMLAGAEIAEYLGDLYYEVSKEIDPAELMMNALADAIINALNKQSSYKEGITEAEEEGSGKPTESPFGDSVLVVKLDDETFDKMESEANSSSAPGKPNVVFVREHPKPTEPAESSGEESGAGAGTSTGDGDESSGTSGAGSASDPSSATKPSESSGGTEPDGSQPSGSGSSDGEGSSGSSAGTSTPSQGTQPSGGSSGTSGEGGSASAQSSGSESGDGASASESGVPNSGPAEENIATDAEAKAEEEAESLRSLKEAAQQSSSQSHVDQSNRFKQMADDFMSGPAVENRKSSAGGYEAPTYDDIEAEYEENGEATSLTAVPRSFKPSAMLPYALMKRGMALKRELQKRIKREELPARTGLRSGSLDGERLARLAMKQVDVFRGQKKTSRPKRPAVFILVDNSGSMCGDKFTQCMEAAAVVEEGFKDLCALKIVAFDTISRANVRHRLIKDWDETGKANLSYNYSLHEGPDGGNKDGFSIRVATKDLLARREREKLLLVLSDGIPTDYLKGIKNGLKDTRDAVSDARRQGVMTVGIYFEEGDMREESITTFRSMYAPAAICVRSDEIEKHLIDVLTRFFFK